MAGLTLRSMFGRLGGLMEAAPGEPTPDQELLARFLAARDAQAFAALMERHAAMVLGVCRRILRNAHDAEDACQAVFLVLARRAGSIQRTGSLASWLHSVAWRVAHKLQHARTRRAVHEVSAASEKPTTSEPGDISWREVQRILDEELNRLPRAYQAPLVLCYLEGRTQDEAARELGWSLGALRGRLERGREMLRLRLTRRGVAGASALVIGALVPNLSSAAVPTTLVAATAQASVPLSVGGPMPASVPAQVAELTRAALQTPLTTKMAWVALVSMTTAILGVALFTWLSPGADPTRVEPRGIEVWSETSRLDVPGFHVWSVAYSADGKQLAAGAVGPQLDSGELRVWDADTQKVRFALETRRGVRCVVFAPDGKTLATAEHDGLARVRDAANGNVLFTLSGHRSQIDTAAFSADGKILATTGWDGTVKLWNTATGMEIRTLKGHHSQVFTVAFGGPDGAIASGGGDQTAKIWRPATGETLFTLRGHGDVVHWLAFSPTDAKILATASWDKTVRLWNAATGKPLATLEGHTEPVLAVAFSPDGKTLASAAGRRLTKNMPGEVILWDMTAQEARARFQARDRVFGLAFAPDGSTLAAACWDGSVTLWTQEPGRVSPDADKNALKFVLADAQAGDEGPKQKEYREDFHPSLKTDRKEVPGLVVYGPDAAECVKFDTDGMRINLPPDYPRYRPGTGVITDFGVKGDFEITVGFEILPQAIAGPVNFPTELRLVVVPIEPVKPEVWHKSSQNRAGLAREIIDRNQAGQFLANATTWTEDIPRDQWNNENFSKVEQQSNQRTPAAATTGRLRLVRSGAMLYFYTSEGDNKDFELLHKSEFGSKDLKNVRILASTGRPGADLDVRIADIRIRADAFPKTATATPPLAIVEPTRRHWWLVPLAIAVPLMLIALSIVGLLVVRMVRRAPAKKTPAPIESDSIAFACKNCGKRLKAKTDRAGARVKCPKCGKPVAVPETTPDAEDVA